MKVAILTQPLGHNYGGILQAYAMQTVLRELGFEPETIDRRKPTSWRKVARDYGKYSIKKLRRRIKTIPTEARKSYIYSNLEEFRSAHLKMSPTLTSSDHLLQYCENQSFDVYLVGSDQVWRPRYSPCLSNFFLDFAANTTFSDKTKISYAASFGVDQWEFSDTQTKHAKSLLQGFSGVSVREKSAVSLCREHLGVNADWVLDPTLLLSRSHYQALIGNSTEPPKQAGILRYVLDESETNNTVISKAEALLEMESFSVKPHKTLQDSTLDDIAACQYPRVESWIQGFQDSEYVITDSFHGTVFAILFNKPFLALGNQGRGLSRFQSLLGLLGLEQRLITSKAVLNKELLETPIDWQTVNERLIPAIKESRAFLVKHLKARRADE